MATERTTILLTGFGPFPGVPENASAFLVERLAAEARRRFPRRHVAAAVLETEWDTAPRRIARLYARERPALALHFGVSARAKGFVIETVGRNRCRDKKDAVGERPGSRCIDEGAPDTLPATLPVERIAARLNDLGIPVALSDDAGGYLCNAVLFHALCLAAAAPQPVAAGFIHIPPQISERPVRRGLDWDAALSGGVEIIRAGLGLPALEPRR